MYWRYAFWKKTQFLLCFGNYFGSNGTYIFSSEATKLSNRFCFASSCFSYFGANQTVEKYNWEPKEMRRGQFFSSDGEVEIFCHRCSSLAWYSNHWKYIVHDEKKNICFQSFGVLILFPIELQCASNKGGTCILCV